MIKTSLVNANRPKLSQSARERIEDLIEAYSFDDESQTASDIRFLLDHHDKVHAAWEDSE